MWSNPRRWLATLRTRRRAILCALLPAFVLSAVSAPACAAMRFAGAGARDALAQVAVAQAYHTHGAAHNAHHAVADGHAGHVPSSDTPSTPSIPCPHCPLAGAAVAGHSSCAAADSADHGGFAPAKDVTERAPLALAPNWLLPATAAVPPLIAAVDRTFTPIPSPVPLNLRHCVLLI